MAVLAVPSVADTVKKYPSTIILGIIINIIVMVFNLKRIILRSALCMARLAISLLGIRLPIESAISTYSVTKIRIDLIVLLFL